MPIITIDSVCPKGPLYPMVVDFENGYPDENFHITCAVLQDRNRNRQIAMELNEVVYAGKEDNEDLEKTLILARNRITGKTRLIEMGRATLKPITKTDLDSIEQQQEADLLKLRNLRKKHELIAPQQKLVVDGVQKHMKNDLSVSNKKALDGYLSMQQQNEAILLGLSMNLPNKYEEFSEEKSYVDTFREQKQNVITAGCNNTLDRLDSSVNNKRDIESYIGMPQHHEDSLSDLNRTITRKQEEILPLERKVDMVKENIENVTATTTYNNVDSVCKEKDFEDVYLPPINREAMRIEDVYCLEKILTKDEQENIYCELQDKDYTKDLHPYVHSLVKGKTLSQMQTVFSVYASELIKFKNVTARHIRRYNLILNRHSKTLNDILINEFTKVVKHRNKHKKNGFYLERVKPKECKDRVICEALLSILILNDYKLQLNPLCNVFKQSITFIKKKLCLLGASVLNDEEAIVQLKLPLAEPRIEETSKMDLSSLQQCYNSMSGPIGKFGLSMQGQNEINDQTLGKQMGKEDNVTDYQQEISAYDENESGSYVSLVNSDETKVKVNPNLPFHQLDIPACDKNNSNDESAALELVKMKQWEKLNADIKTVRKTVQMKNYIDCITDNQLNLSANDENDSDNHIKHIHTDEIEIGLDSLQKRHKTNKLEKCKENRSKEYKKQMEWQETLNSDFQDIMQYPENLNGYVEFEHIDISAYIDNGSDDESGTLKPGWKFESKKNKIEQQNKFNADQENITVTDEYVNGSVMDGQLDISHDTDTDSDDLYILPRNRESTIANVDSLQQSNGAKKKEKTRKVVSINNDECVGNDSVMEEQLDISYDTDTDSNDLYILPRNRESTKVSVDFLQQSNEAQKKEKPRKAASINNDECANGSDMDDQLDISYDRKDSKDLYIPPKNREPTKVNIDSLQKNNEAKKTEKTRKIASMNKDKGDDFYVPPINREACEVEDVYPVEKILSKDEYEKIYFELQENDLSDLHPYVQTCIENKSLSLNLKVLALYASDLLKILHLKRQSFDSKTCKICHHSNTLNGIIVKEFTVPDKRHKVHVSQCYKDKIVCHVIVFMLILNYFKLKLEPLCAAVRLSPLSIRKKLALIGASVAETGDMVQLKLPLIPKCLTTCSGKSVFVYKKSHKNYSNEYYLPPLNKQASTVDELYRLEDILTVNEYETIYLDIQKYDYTTDLHTYVQSLLKNKTLSPRHIVLAVYGSELIKFLLLRAVCIRSPKFILCHHSKTLNNIILKEFSELTSFPSGQVYRVKTGPLKHKIMCHVIVFMLILNGFKLELQPLKAAMARGNNHSFLNIQAISSVGATIVDGDDGEMIKLKLLPKCGFKKS